MNRFMNYSLAAVFAAFLTLGSIGAIVTVPPAQAAVSAAYVMPEIA